MPFVLAYINWKFWKKRKRENNKNNPYDLSSFFTWRWHIQHRAEWEKKNLERVFIIPFWRCMTGVTWEKWIPNWAAYQYSTSVRKLSSHYTHQIRLSMTLKKSNVLHISNEGRWRKKKWGENMSQEYLPSLITPLGHFIFSCLLGGFWSHQRLRRKKTSQQQRNTSHFFCQDPTNLWQLQLQNKLFTEHIFLSDLRRRPNLKVAYRGEEEVKLDQLPHMIQQSFTTRSISCYLQPFIMKYSQSTSPRMIWRWLCVTEKK